MFFAFMLTQEQIDQIIQEAIDDPRVQTVLLAGSYAYGKPTDKSDLDVRCLTHDGSDWAEFERIRFGTTIEIFFNPPDKIRGYFEEDRNSQVAMCISAWDQGKLLYDVNGAGLELKKEARELFLKGPHKGKWKESKKHNI